MLEQAKAEAAARQAALAEAAKVATQATTVANEAQSQLSASDAAAKLALDGLSAADAAQKKLTADVASQTAIIADLEAKLGGRQTGQGANGRVSESSRRYLSQIKSRR